MNLLELLARFLEYLFVWLPRPVYTPRCDAAVVWVWSREPVVRRGLWWYVPLFMSHETLDLRDHPANFEPNVLWTRDGREAAIGMLVLWYVKDPLVCGQRMAELRELVARAGESVLPELVGRFTLEELKRKAAGGEGREWAFDAHLQVKLEEALDYYGIGVRRARLNFTSDRTRTFKVIGSGSGKDEGLKWDGESWGYR